MFRIVFVFIAIMSNFCVASEWLKERGFYPENMAEVKSPEQAAQRSEQEQQQFELRQKNAQLQKAFTAADLINAQPVEKQEQQVSLVGDLTKSQPIIFNFSDKKIDIEVPQASVWIPQRIDEQVEEKDGKYIFYYVPNERYNQAAMDFFRILIYKKTKEEVTQFWRDFFKPQFEYGVDFANIRDGLFDLIDATQAQDVLLSGLIVITVNNDSVWRLKTVDNMRGLPNGDVLYYIIDEHYDKRTIRMFKDLVNRQTKEEVEQFWQKFSSLTADATTKKIIEEQLVSIIYHAKAQDVLFAGFLYSIQFTRSSNIIATASIHQKQIALFDYLKTILEDLTNVPTIPVPLDYTDINGDQVTEVFDLLLQYLSSAQDKIDAVNRMKDFVGDKEERILRDIGYACIEVYREKSLDLILQSLALALYLGLQQPYSTYLADVYVNKLMESKFSTQGELLQILPTNLDVDTFVVKIMMQKLLADKYLYSKSLKQNMRYLGSGHDWGTEPKVVCHKSSVFRDPYFFMRSTVRSGVFLRWDDAQSLTTEGRLLHLSFFNTGAGLDRDVFDIVIFGVTDAVIITKDKIKIVRFNSQLQRLEEGMSQKLPIVGATDGFIRQLSADRFCAGFDDYIALFSIKNNKIVDFKSYKIEAKNKGVVSDLFVLDNMVAISYKPLAGGYRYFFFDANNGVFLKEPSNALEIQFMHLRSGSPMLYKKMIVLMRNKDLCINRALIMNARKFTQLSLIGDIFIDSEQENIYLAYASGAVGKYELIPSDLKPAINAINNAEKALRGKEQRTHLTLDFLYFIAHKHKTMVAAPDNIKKLEKFVSAPMKAALQTTRLNKVKSSYFSWSDAFKRRFKWFAGAVAGLGLAGIITYFSTKARNLYTPQSSAAYSKLQIPKTAQ